MSDPDLLIDDVPQPRRRPGRPTKEEAERKRREKMAEPLPHYTEFRKPVGVTFLANIVGKQPKQIQKRLEKCPVVKWENNRSPLYDFMTAMSYLIPPRGNIEEWFGQQNTASLPAYINKMFWDSAAQRNRVMLQSNDLWHSEDVMVVFGRVATAIRTETNMWIENLPEKELLTDKQYGALVDAKNRLIDEIRQILITQPRATLSMTAHIRSEIDASGSTPQDEIFNDYDDEE